MPRPISEFITKLNGGVALSTNYEVTFEFNNRELNERLKAAVTDSGIGSLSGNGLITMLCSEAQLPSVSSLTGQQQGLFLGESQVSYSYGKLYTDTSLGWICDKDMKPLKFLQEWHDQQFTYAMVRENARFSTTLVRSEVKNRMKFPKEYQGKIKIKKLEPEGVGDRPSMVYTLIDAFPYSIDATPLSYGTSQLITVSANFYYSKYFIDYGAAPRKTSRAVSEPVTQTPLSEEQDVQKFEYVPPKKYEGIDAQKDPGSRFAA